MGVTNFKQFDVNKVNMVDDATYGASGYRLNGATSGVAPSAIHNKLFYQTSTMVSALAQSLANQGFTVNDTDFDALVAVLSNLGNGNRMQVFVTNGSFVVPAPNVYVSQCGGGGGGASWWGMGGGGGASVYRQLVTNLVIGQSIPVTIGAGGIAGYGPISTTNTNSGNWDTIFANNQCSGGNGLSTSFGSYVVTPGGNGALATATKASVGARGGVGGGRGHSQGLSNITAISGTQFDQLSHGGKGGDSLFGTGGTGGQFAYGTASDPLPGTNGVGFGSGGGGGSDYKSQTTNVYRTTPAGSGSPGICIIEW